MLKDLPPSQKSFYVSTTGKWWTLVADESRLVLVSRKRPAATLRPTPEEWWNECNWFCIYDPRYDSYPNSEYYERERIPRWISRIAICWYQSTYTESMPLSEFLYKTGPEGVWNVRLSSPIYDGKA